MPNQPSQHHRGPSALRLCLMGTICAAALLSTTTTVAATTTTASEGAERVWIAPEQQEDPHQPEHQHQHQHRQPERQQAAAAQTGTAAAAGTAAGTATTTTTITASPAVVEPAPGFGVQPLAVAKGTDPPLATAGAVCTLSVSGDTNSSSGNGGKARVLWLGGRQAGVMGTTYHSKALSLLDLGSTTSTTSTSSSSSTARWAQPHLDEVDPFSGRSAAAFASHGNRTWVFGGRTGMFQHSNELFVLDEHTLQIRLVRPQPPAAAAAQGSHPAAAVVPQAREGHSAAFANGGRHLVVFGGRGGNDRHRCLGDLAVFDTTDGRWAVHARVEGADPRYGHASAVVNGGSRLYLFGGKCGDSFVDGLTVIDLDVNGAPTGPARAAQPSIPGLQRVQHTVTLVGGGSVAYVVGGFGEREEAAGDILAIDLDGTSPSVSQVADARIPRYGHCVVHQPAPANRLVILGGDNLGGGGSFGLTLSLQSPLANLVCRDAPRLQPTTKTLEEKMSALLGVLASLTEICTSSVSTLPQVTPGEPISEEETRRAHRLLAIAKELPTLVQEASRHLAEATGQQEEYDREYGTFSSELNAIGDAASQLNARVKQFLDDKAHAEALEREIQSTTQEIQRVTPELNTHRQGLALARAKRDQLAGDETALKGTVEELARRVEELAGQLREYEEWLATATENDKLRSELQSELAAKERDLSNLVAIHEHRVKILELANSTGCVACDNDLQNLSLAVQHSAECIQELELTIAELRQRINALGESKTGPTDVTAEHTEATENLAKDQQQLEDLSARLADADALLSQMKKDTQLLEEQLAGLQAQLTDLEGQRGGNAASRLEAEVDELYGRVMRLVCKSNKLARTSRNLEITRKALLALREQIDNLNKELRGLRSNLGCQDEGESADISVAIISP